MAEFCYTQMNDKKTNDVLFLITKQDVIVYKFLRNV